MSPADPPVARVMTVRHGSHKPGWIACDRSRATLARADEAGRSPRCRWKTRAGSVSRGYSGIGGAPEPSPKPIASGRVTLVVSPLLRRTGVLRWECALIQHEPEGRALECLGAPADRGDPGAHAAVPPEQTVGDRDEQAVRRGARGEPAQSLGEFRRVPLRGERAGHRVGGGRRTADAGIAVQDQRVPPVPGRREIEDGPHMRLAGGRWPSIGATMSLNPTRR